jgi:hypothetical protein
MIAITFFVVMTAGALTVTTGVGATAFGPATLIQGLVATGVVDAGVALTMSTVLTSAAIEAAAVGAVGGLAGTGLTNGVTAPYTGASSGFETITPPSGEPQRSMYDGTIAKFDTPTVVGSGMLGVSQGLYGSRCAPGSA